MFTRQCCRGPFCLEDGSENSAAVLQRTVVQEIWVVETDVSGEQLKQDVDGTTATQPGAP